MGRAAPTCIRKVTGVRNAPRCNVGAATEAHTLHRQTLQFAEQHVMECGAVDPKENHSGLMPANLTTLAHFSVSAATKLPKSEGEPAITVPPRSASRALSWGSARAVLISLLSLLTISAGVPVGAPTPYQPLDS